MLLACAGARSFLSTLLAGRPAPTTRTSVSVPRGDPLLDFDVEALLRAKIARDRRPPDGKLHASGDLVGSLRHAQLRAAGAPTVVSDIVADVRMRTGTLIHHDFERIFRGRPVMLEVKLDEYMPTGWSGTADWIAWNAERKAFVLGDLKTAKAEGIPWIIRDGIKDSHQHQLSAYWYALRKMGLPLVRGYAVMYLPITQDVREPVQPTLQEADPLPEDYMMELMADRWGQTSAYLLEVAQALESEVKGTERFLQPSLAPVQEREIRTYWNKAVSKAKGVETPGVEVKLVPNWSTSYCDYPNELCDCRTQKPEKLGHWMAVDEGVVFTASRGKQGLYDPADPVGHPSSKQIKELKDARSSQA